MERAADVLKVWPACEPIQRLSTQLYSRLRQTGTPLADEDLAHVSPLLLDLWVPAFTFTLDLYQQLWLGGLLDSYDLLQPPNVGVFGVARFRGIAR
jgi:hypothetical protein